MKRVLLIIAPVDFRDEEFLEPKNILGKLGVQVTVASTQPGTAKGSRGAFVKADIALKDISVAKYDAFVFVGGNGASVFFDDPQAHRIAQDAVKQQKLLAAICIAPVTLARAGVLRGVKATVFPDESDELTKKGAVYTGKPVEIAGNIITGAGPHAARQFGQAIAAHLTATT
ncbi:MAG: DJ-1/PfpI family protein [Candidatus Omnitrophica bacterium]|nr:DJ-1/PfpI family protein [Candidatus Omnitrophota bacterium]